jgi:ABC-type multidrug transport system fused ATPase/permease subunit
MCRPTYRFTDLLPASPRMRHATFVINAAEQGVRVQAGRPAAGGRPNSARPSPEWTIEAGLAVGATTVAMTWTGVALALGLIATGAGASANALGAEVGTRMSGALRLALFDQITAQPYAFHAQSKAGAVVSRLTRSPSAANNLIQSIFGGLVGQGVLLVPAVVTLGSINVSAVLVVLAMVPLFMIPFRVFTKRLLRPGVTRRPPPARSSTSSPNDSTWKVQCSGTCSIHTPPNPRNSPPEQPRSRRP